MVFCIGCCWFLFWLWGATVKMERGVGSCGGACFCVDFGLKLFWWLVQSGVFGVFLICLTFLNILGSSFGVAIIMLNR